MIFGVDTCRRHTWKWVSMSVARCTKCDKETSGHAQEVTSNYCLTCRENHGAR